MHVQDHTLFALQAAGPSCKAVAIRIIGGLIGGLTKVEEIKLIAGQKIEGARGGEIRAPLENGKDSTQIAAQC